MKVVFLLFVVSGSLMLFSVFAQVAAIIARSGNVDLANVVGFFGMALCACLAAFGGVWVWKSI